MRTIPQRIWDIWSRGGPFIGDQAAHSRVTVEKDWWLNVDAAVAPAAANRYPFRWWQRADNSQLETEVPNVMAVDWSRDLATDTGECTISLWNSRLDPNMAGQSNMLGDPGYLLARKVSPQAVARWGPMSSDWEGVLESNALLRTYQGYGGHHLSIPDAVAQGYLVLTGVWLIDDVTPRPNGDLAIKCRDMGKLLIEQPLLPPLVPDAHYPLVYKRWTLKDVTYQGIVRYTKVKNAAGVDEIVGLTKVYDKSNPTQNSPVPAEGPKWLTDVAIDSTGAGYWSVGTDGGVFSRNVAFHGSRGAGSAADAGPALSMAANPTGAGYWLLIADGTVHTFGGARWQGDASSYVFAGQAVRIRATATGLGYWILTDRGQVYEFGDADNWGEPPAAAAGTYVDLQPTPTGLGYWVLRADGEVLTFGDATYHGRRWEPVVAMAPAKDGAGYWLLRAAGPVAAFGSAPTLTPLVIGMYPPFTLSPSQYVTWNGAGGIPPETGGDPPVALAVTPTGKGLISLHGDGMAYFWGDAPDVGPIKYEWRSTQKLPGNYADYTDIIKDILLWSGWQLRTGQNIEQVYGTLETTGAWSEEALNADLFSMKKAIDGIGQVKEVVGYHFFIDDEGAARFVSPNWFRLGNRMEDGTYTRRIPELDEAVQLTDLQPTDTDRGSASEIIISTADPTKDMSTTVTTRRALSSTLPKMRGIFKPAMWFNGNFTKKAEQEAMAELLEHHIAMARRGATVTCAANPAIERNDQVRIWARATRTTGVHYVHGITSSHDLRTGVWKNTYTVNELPEGTR